MLIDPRFISILFILLMVSMVVVTVVFLFWKKLYSKITARIVLLVLSSSLMTLMITLAINEVTRDTLTPAWFRLMQIILLFLGSPVLLGLLAAYFVRKPLRHFNDAIASLEQENYKTQLPPTGIQELDEVYIKFNQLTQRLQYEEKLRKDLVSDTSHELNTPLTTMLGQLTAMQEGKYALTSERVGILKEQTERLADLIQQLNAYTKARMPHNSELVDVHLRQFCHECIQPFRMELEEKGIAVRLVINDDEVARIDPLALRQIITNLLQNALRYSHASEITIAATSWQLVFSDNGKGVPAKSLPYLFERFYRVDGSRSRSTGGLGLGLAIVKEITDQQGWRISVKNGHPGLHFTIHF